MDGVDYGTIFIAEYYNQAKKTNNDQTAFFYLVWH